MKLEQTAGLRVLHVAQTAQGGVGSYLEEIVPVQARRYGPESIRVVLPEPHAALFPALQGPWLQGFDPGGAGRLRSSVRMAQRATQLLRTWCPDVVHLQSTCAGVFMRPVLAAMPRRPLVVYCAHGWAFDRDTGAAERAAVRQVERWLSSWSDVIVCVSEFEANRARAIGIDPRRLSVVPNGLSDLPDSPSPEPAFAEWPADVLRVLFVGRLDRQKGVDVLYDALRRLGQRAHAVVVGAAVVGDEAGAEPPPNVSLLGWRTRPELTRLYAAADVLVVPSRWEAFGLVAIEAMRSCVPVLASRVGGLPEVVDHGVTGLLVPPEDGAALAHALGSLDRGSLRRWGRAGRERFVRLFRAERVVAQLDTLYLDDRLHAPTQATYRQRRVQMSAPPKRPAAPIQ